MLAILILVAAVYGLIACGGLGSGGCGGSCKQGRYECDCKKL